MAVDQAVQNITARKDYCAQYLGTGVALEFAVL